MIEMREVVMFRALAKLVLLAKSRLVNVMEGRDSLDSHCVDGSMPMSRSARHSAKLVLLGLAVFCSSAYSADMAVQTSNGSTIEMVVNWDGMSNRQYVGTTGSSTVTLTKSGDLPAIGYRDANLVLGGVQGAFIFSQRNTVSFPYYDTDWQAFRPTCSLADPDCGIALIGFDRAERAVVYKKLIEDALSNKNTVLYQARRTVLLAGFTNAIEVLAPPSNILTQLYDLYDALPAGDKSADSHAPASLGVTELLSRLLANSTASAALTNSGVFAGYPAAVVTRIRTVVNTHAATALQNPRTFIPMEDTLVDIMWRAARLEALENSYQHVISNENPLFDPAIADALTTIRAELDLKTESLFAPVVALYTNYVANNVSDYLNWIQWVADNYKTLSSMQAAQLDLAKKGAFQDVAASYYDASKTIISGGIQFWGVMSALDDKWHRLFLQANLIMLINYQDTNPNRFSYNDTTGAVPYAKLRQGFPVVLDQLTLEFLVQYYNTALSFVAPDWGDVGEQFIQDTMQSAVELYSTGGVLAWKLAYNYAGTGVQLGSAIGTWIASHYNANQIQQAHNDLQGFYNQTDALLKASDYWGGLIANQVSASDRTTFTNNGDGTVTDIRTGLTWMRCSIGQTWSGSSCSGSIVKMTWSQAMAITSDFAGFSDWRIPSTQELVSLIGSVDTSTYPSLVSNVFPNMSIYNLEYWSGSHRMVNIHLQVEVVNYVAGQAYLWGANEMVSVRLVRGPKSLGFAVLSVSSIEGASVTSADGRIACGATCSANYYFGDNVRLTASAPSKAFEWTGACTGVQATCDLTMDSAKSVGGIVSIPPSPPSQPKIGNVIPGDKQVTIHFSESDSDGGSPIEWYNAYSTPDFKFGYGFGSPITVTGLVNGRSYSFKVGARNAAGYTYSDPSITVSPSAPPSDTTPDQFTFTTQTNVELSAIVTSNSVAVSGINAAVPISISGGSYSINGGAYTSSSGTVTNGQIVTAQVASSSSNSTTTFATLSIGGISSTFSVTTKGDVQMMLALASGWNLLGNSLNQPLSVDTLFADPNVVSTVWKWESADSRWLFFTPMLDATAMQTYATGKGYGVLSQIAPGEGYWVNAKIAAELAAQTGTAFELTAAHLASGWNLVATGQDVTPATFNRSLSETPPSPSVVPQNVTSLWAWDNPANGWYFYAPSLEAQGGTALTDYITSKGYRDFTQHNRRLGNGQGFWVKRP